MADIYKEEVYSRVVDFIERYEVRCKEALYQRDDIIRDLPIIVENLCDVVGYYEDEGED